MVVIALLLLIDLQKFGHFHHVSSVTNLVIKLVAGECNKTDYMHTARVFLGEFIVCSREQHGDRTQTYSHPNRRVLIPVVLLSSLCDVTSPYV